MPTATYYRRARHDPDDLVEMVSKVEDYPKFVNLISAMRVKKKTQVTETHSQFEADANVSYKFLSEQFGSLVDVHTDKRLIKVIKSERGGALKTLKNHWKFHPLSDGSTLVEFFITVELRPFPLNSVLRQTFENAGRKIMNIFENQAADMYETIGAETLDLNSEYEALGLKRIPELV